MGGFPGGKAFLGLVDFDLGDLRVPLISPHGIRAEVLTGTIDVILSGHISHSTSLIVLGYLHTVPVTGVGQ